MYVGAKTREVDDLRASGTWSWSFVGDALKVAKLGRDEGCLWMMGC